MSVIKERSTNQENKQILQKFCPVTFTLEKIGGRWKPLILYNLGSGAMRYGQLRRSIPAITEKMLIQHLRELEADGLISRAAKAVVPPHVEYRLTASGETLGPVLNGMAEWGRLNIERGSRSTRKEILST
jgi:DNA-binding HxlR family transcriptional regulator